jgi:dolichol-phosphate mannosyltransferase
MITLHTYDIHGIISVVSDAGLPELESFRVPRSIDEPTIRVRIGKPVKTNGHSPNGHSSNGHSPNGQSPNGHSLNGHSLNGHSSNGVETIKFSEWTGWHGFGIEITRGNTIEVSASSLLGKSPHVLYTNVVEPILRWSFVERGFALVHGACLACGEDAFLVTARTDTGKTTTILRTLDAQPDFDFLSDDLTIISPDGRVLPYPKPLTISRHTLVAVKTPLLSRKERTGLFFQSRLHSRSGRRFGLLLTKSGMPMATTNAVIQRLVPPPKYPVERLVPQVKVAPSAKLAGLIVIERGGRGEVTLAPDEALEILMANCEDSYGFPPYDTIKSFLYGSDGYDLRPVERLVVASALAGRPATLIRSETRDWWQRLPAFVSCSIGSVSPRLKTVASGQTSAAPAPVQAG